MIYHVTTVASWSNNENDDSYCPEAFFREGFIHACRSAQLEGVLHRYFSGQTNLLLLHIEEAKLTCTVKEELSTGNEMFPHIYGRINKDAIVRVERLER